ncbi:MAG: queuosine precursor transporter [Chloroflexi bacterium]|nr:queuosine precursor transporter [Chloroflexota bacterium]MCC6896962.1 queuosine precursor transporter [Anaerolineae bacterium]
MNTSVSNRRLYKHLDTVTASLVAVLIISNIAATKIIQVGPFSFDGGTFLFPLSYIFGDILTEVYGYKSSRRVIWTGFFWLFVTAIVLMLVDGATPAGDWPFQDSFHTILGQTPRIVIASLAGFLAGEFSNSYVLAKMKIWTQGKHLWARTIGSTVAGELVDTIVFTLIAFGGVFTNDLLLSLIVSAYLFKLGIEVLFTPITYRVVSWLKEVEKEDYYDIGTNFNPFAIGDVNRKPVSD